MSYNYENEKTISEFNESIFQLQRLHNNWLEIAIKRKRGDFEGTRWVLDSQEAELEFDAEKLDEDNDKEHIKKIEEVNKEIDKAWLEKNYLNRRIKIYQALLKKEKILRKVQQESGKGAKYKSLDEDSLD